MSRSLAHTMEIVRSSSLEVHHSLHERDADLENAKSITYNNIYDRQLLR